MSRADVLDGVPLQVPYHRMAETLADDSARGYDARPHVTFTIRHDLCGRPDQCDAPWD